MMSTDKTVGGKTGDLGSHDDDCNGQEVRGGRIEELHG